MRHRLGREWRIEKKANKQQQQVASGYFASLFIELTSLPLFIPPSILHTNDARPTHPHHLPSQQQHIQTHLPRRPTPRMDPSTPRYHTARCRVRPCGSWTHERVEQGLVRGMCVELSTFCLTLSPLPLPTRRKSNPKCSPSTHAASNTSSPPPSPRTITKREEATWYVIGKAQMWLFRKCLAMYVWRVFLFWAS